MDQNDDADDIELVPVTRRMVCAATAPPLRPHGPCSVFALDLRPVLWRPAADNRMKVGRRIERDVGIVRCITFSYSDTAEAKAAEAARRARQKPPPPGSRYIAAGNAQRSAKQIAMFHIVHATNLADRIGAQ